MNPTQTQYGSTNQPPAHHGSPHTPGLPVTGFDLGLFFVAGVALIAAGSYIRNHGRNR